MIASPGGYFPLVEVLWIDFFQLTMVCLGGCSVFSVLMKNLRLDDETVASVRHCEKLTPINHTCQPDPHKAWHIKKLYWYQNDV
jgi:hypothetical protein